MRKRIVLCFLCVIFLLMFCSCKCSPDKSSSGDAIITDGSGTVSPDTDTDSGTERPSHSEPGIPEADGRQYPAQDNSGTLPDSAQSEASGSSKGSGEKASSVSGADSSSVSSSNNPAPMKWEEFYALSPTEKDAYKNSYKSMDDFIDWVTEAQEQYKTEHPDKELGPGGEIDWSDLGN